MQLSSEGMLVDQLGIEDHLVFDTIKQMIVHVISSKKSHSHHLKHQISKSVNK